MKFDDARKREIRIAEVDRAIEDILRALGVKRIDSGTRNLLIGALAEYALQTRRPWDARDRHQRFLDIVDKYTEKDDRQSKLLRLIDHPNTSAEERAAAQRALARLNPEPRS